MGIFASVLLLAAGLQAAQPPTGIGAEGACLRQAMRLFPEFASWLVANRERVLREEGISPTPVLPDQPAIGVSLAFRLPDGSGFVAAFPPSIRAAFPTVNLTCVGDVERRVITSIHFNNVIRRPAAGQDWSF